MINKDTYKRFTELKTYNNGKKMYVQYSVSGCYNDMNRKGDYTTGDSVDRLAKLEDKIENGTLVELPCVAYNVKECRYQIISTKNGRVYVSKFYRTREEAEVRLKELQEGKK